MFRIRLHLLLYNLENSIEVNNPVNLGRIFDCELWSGLSMSFGRIKGSSHYYLLPQFLEVIDAPVLSWRGNGKN